MRVAQPIRWLGVGVLLTLGGTLVCCVGPFVLAVVGVLTSVVAGGLGRWDLSVASIAFLFIGIASFVLFKRRSKKGEKP
jgi:membrane protein implicated in regulation of membrane protease activity